MGIGAKRGRGPARHCGMSFSYKNARPEVVPLGLLNPKHLIERLLLILRRRTRRLRRGTGWRSVLLLVPRRWRRQQQKQPTKKKKQKVAGGLPLRGPSIRHD